MVGETDPGRIPYYMAASTVLLALIIWSVASIGSARRIGVAAAFGVAAAVSVVGILFAKFGANFGLPWQVYYTVPMLATVLGPPVVFRFNLARWLAYVGLAGVSAPLIHAGFFYALGWSDYMPFLHLPR
ncbi:MAG: hypothetical protein JNM59_13650 [Hyphomonadaceae bacterium]|nr:hypothetical protein [Hyphomonadaceae bacterium]